MDEPRKLASYKPEADSYGPETETYKSEITAKPKLASRVDHKRAYMIFLQ
jgi:hypothetical protein